MSSKSMLVIRLFQGNDVAATLAQIAQIPHVGKMEQVFPNDADSEMASLYTMDVASANAESVRVALQTNVSGVEYAEYAPTRHTMRK